MNIKYDITYQNNEPYIIYNPNALTAAMKEGKEIIFEYTANLNAADHHRSYNLFEAISEINPMILKKALLNSSLPQRLSMANQFRIAQNIVQHVDKDHENYNQYLDIFDLLISKDSSLLQYNLYPFYLISNTMDNKKYDFFNLLLNNKQLLEQCLTTHQTDLIRDMIKFISEEAETNHQDGYSLIAKLLTSHNAPTIETISLDNEKLAKIFCIASIKNDNYTEAKKIINSYNFSITTEKDILKIVQETNKDRYEEISTYISDVKHTRTCITAIKTGNDTEFSSILQQIKDINIEIGKKSLITLSIEAKNLYAIQEIIKKDITSIFTQKDTALELALNNENIEVIDTIYRALKNQPNNDEYINMFFQKTLRYAVKTSTFAVLESLFKLLQEHPADIVKKHSEEALLTAVENYNNKNIIQFLIDNGADVNCQDQNGDTPLIKAHALRHTHNTLALIENNANINNLTNNDLIDLLYAEYDMVLCYNINTVKILTKKLTADIKATDDNGKAALMYAISSNCKYSIIKLILDAGADVNATDDSGNTTLMKAMEHYHVDSKIIDLIVNAGANVNAPNNNRETALMKLLDNYSPNPNIIKLLLTKGADVNASANNQKTVLHYLFKYNRSVVYNSEVKYILKLFLDNGLDMNLENNKFAISDILHKNAKNDNNINLAKDLKSLGMLSEELYSMYGNSFQEDCTQWRKDSSQWLKDDTTWKYELKAVSLEYMIPQSTHEISYILDENDNINLTKSPKRSGMLEEESNSMNMKTHEQHDDHALQSENHDEAERAEENNHITNNESNYDNHDELEVTGDNNAETDA